MRRLSRRAVLRSPFSLWFLGLLCLCEFLLASNTEQDWVRFAVIGDSGTGEEPQYRVARLMAAWHERLPYDLVLMLGDNVYGGFFGRGGGNRKGFGEKFDQPYAELLRRGVIFRAALGNHDTTHRGGKDLIEAQDRFHMDGAEGYYRFVAGEWKPEGRSAGSSGPAEASVPVVEFFVLNTTRLVDGRNDRDQMAWLERSLAASRAPWRIVYGHHPMYSTGRRHGGDAGLRAKLEPIFMGSSSLQRDDSSRGGPRVQVYLAGHDHIYERFHPQKGITYIVCGSSGQLRQGNAGRSQEAEAIEDRQHVFMLWEATPELLRFRAINEQGKAFDCGVVRRAGSAQSVPCPAWAGFQY